MKKGRVLLVFVLLFISLFYNSSLTSAQVNVIDPSALDNIDKSADFLEQKKWDYLSAQWKEVLLKNKFVSVMDSFFKKINFVFLLLTGRNYDLSLTLFWSLLIWGFFFVFVSSTLANFSTLSKGVSYIIGFAVSVISAQLGIYGNISEFMFKVIFYKDGVWSWVEFFLFLFLLLFFITLYSSIVKTIARNMRIKRRAMLRKAEERNQKILQDLVTDIVDVGKK